ncbi:MAG: cyclic 2,3-diphosphoglycerate synthase [Acidobacteriota bacterium]|nr:cyclic 2,3-diphosphoglycerate synthase [Acidobacteriota bacterium]
MKPTRVLILGAAGRDFHNFNTCFRGRPEVQVMAFTATQIPDIAGRRYPAELAGEGYPEGIQILDEQDLEQHIRDLEIDEVVFAYSDISHEHVMHLASRALAAGADFRLLGPERTLLSASVPVVSICAVRTGCGKSQTSRRVCEILREAGKRVVVVRHPMPYGDLARQTVQRFATIEDLKSHDCTVEEMEEYEPHITCGTVVYAGVDYQAILRRAEAEADVVIWDGGNNDLPFFRADIEIVVVDPHRTGHELCYHPGEANLRRADCVVINKVDSAAPENVKRLRETIREVNPGATIVEADSLISLDTDNGIAGKRVLAIEDGPTLTHGGMKYGAASVAANRQGASELVDPRDVAVGKVAETFSQYPDLGPVLPAVGYGAEQIADLEATIQRVDCDVILIGTPVDLRRLVRFPRPAHRVSYNLVERGEPSLTSVLKPVLG